MTKLTLSFSRWLWLALVWLLVACAPTASNNTPPTASSAAATSTLPPTATTETTVPATPAPTDVPPATLPTTDTGGELPVSETLALNLVNQFGGVPQALKVVGTTIYAGFGSRLMVIDASNAAAPQRLGQSEPLPDLVYGVDVVNGLAYVAAGRVGLLLLDVQNPAQIQVVGTGFRDAAADSFQAEAITIRQNTAYLVHFDRPNSVKTLYRLDVTNPTQINLLSQHTLDVNDELVIGDDVLYVVGLSRLQIREAANPDNILNQTTLISGSYAANAAAAGNTLFVAESGGPTGLELFDVSDPTAPTGTGSLIEMDFFFVNQVLTNGQVLVIGGTFGEFGYCSSTIQVIAISTGQPELQNSFDPTNCLSEMALEGNRLYVAGRSGLQLYDLTDPTQPTLLSQFAHPDGFHNAQGVALTTGATYMLTSEGRGYDLLTLDLKQAPPKLLSDKLALGSNVLLDLFVAGQTLLVPQWMGGLNTLDISDPAQPTLVHQTVEGELNGGDLFAFAIQGTTVYMPVVDGVLVGGIGAVNVTDPANPTLTGTVTTGDYQTMALTVADGVLYVLSQGDAGTHVSLYSLQEPLQPVLISVVTLPEAASRLSVFGNTIYVACDQWNCQTLYAIDVTNRETPTMTQTWALPFGVWDMVSDGQGIIYLMTADGWVWALDVTDAGQPHLVGSTLIPGGYARLRVVGNTVYAAAGEAGLFVFEVVR